MNDPTVFAKRIVGFRRNYGMCYRAALRELPLPDLLLLVEGLEEWAPQHENVAMLVDRLDYWLTSEYRSWVTDPNDPEVQRARAERKRSGIKPPEKPIIWPVAKRPERVHAVQVQAAIDLANSGKNTTSIPEKESRIELFRRAFIQS